MAMRRTRADIQQILDILNKAQNVETFTIGRAYGRMRIHCRNESKDVSPRLPAGQLYEWASAFLDGFGFAREGQM